MAPKKETSSSSSTANDAPDNTKLTPAQSSSLILSYLQSQNRPYSAIDISANLENRVTKTAAAKLLKDLHERGEIEGRVAGKGVVYHAVQEEIDPSTLDATLLSLESNTAALRDETAKLKLEEKDLRSALRSSTTTPSTNNQSKQELSIADLQLSLTSLASQRTNLQFRVTKFHGDADNKGQMMVVPSPAEKEAILRENARWNKILKARGKICRELWAEVGEVVGKEKLGEVREELGLEF